jgi:glycosyltransferase involved in cell wall biosynthesis
MSTDGDQRGAPATLLMLAFDFPPMATVGVHRSVRLARHLPEHGIRPVVITTDRESLRLWSGRELDETLVDELPPDLTVYRVPCPRPAGARLRLVRRLGHFFSSGEDLGRRWAPQLAAMWDRAVAESKPAALYVTAPPFSVVPYALALARRSGLPLIIDFRDAWSQWCHNASPTWWHYRAKLRAERASVAGAQAIVGVTRQLLEDLRHVHPDVDAAKFHAAPSGFDAATAAPPSRDRPRDDTRPFVIGYVGGFYYSPEMRASVMEPWWRKRPAHWLQYSPRQEDWLYRSPYFFFRALAHLFDQRPELRRQVRVRFAGDRQAWLDRQAADFGVQDVVEQLGHLPHAACLEFESRCDALLTTSMKVIGGRDYCIAGKTFEYIAAGRPILGIVTEGEQRDFLVSSGAAVVADADDIAGSARAIEQIVTGQFVPAPAPAFLEGFHGRETSRRLAALVRSVAQPRG